MKSGRSILTLVLAFYIFAISPVLSQDIFFKKVSPPEDVPWGGYITGIGQDTQGFLWITSAGVGLIKYDGYRFTVYQHDELNDGSVSSNGPECVLVDRSGVIWIGALGLDRYDPSIGIFTHYRSSEKDSLSLSDNYVTCLLEDSQGILWVGTNKGLNILDRKTGKFTRFLHRENDSSTLSDNQVRVIYEDRQGTIWVGCRETFRDGASNGIGGLNKLDRNTGTFVRYLHEKGNANSLLDNRVRAILEDSHGNFWVGTAQNGLHSMDRETGKFTRYVYDPKHPEKLSAPPPRSSSGADDHVTFIREDVTGALWIGTFNNGVSRYDAKSGKITRYYAENRIGGFADSSSWWAYQTKDGVLWISTSYSGTLYRIDPYKKEIPFHPLAGGSVSFLEDSKGILWIGTANGLVGKQIREKKEIRLVHDSTNPSSISNDFVTAICEDRMGNIWAAAGPFFDYNGNDFGLNRLDKKTRLFSRFGHDPRNGQSFTGGRVYGIIDDGQGSLWIGMDKGLDQLNVQTGLFRHFIHDPKDTNSLAGNRVTSILQHKTGDIWIGTWGNGLDRFEPHTGRFNHVIPGLNIISLFQDSKGEFWVGTDIGIYHSRDRRHFSLFSIPGKQVDFKNVVKIVEDKHKNIWIRTFTQILQLDSSRREVKVYGKTSGVDTYMMPRAPEQGLIGKDGIIYFSGSWGYYSFLPDELRSNPTLPQVVILGVRIEKPESDSTINGQAAKLVPNEGEINLRHNQNAFHVDFAGIHYSDPEYNKHLYMLENYDNQWRQAGADLTAHYYNIPPGEYIFRIKAASSSGLWSEKILAINIHPPWWKTWWAYLLYILGFITLLTAFIRWRIASLKKDKLILENQVSERTAQLKDSLENLRSTQQELIQREKMASLGELTAGIAHEIQNPLNFVNNFAEVNTELNAEGRDAFKSGNWENAEEILGMLADNNEKILYHGKRADAIVKGMLQHSRASTGVKEPTEINALVDEYFRLAYHGMRAKDKSFNSDFSFNPDPDVGKVTVVPQDIGRVMVNLINNAFYAVYEKAKSGDPDYAPRVEVSTERAGNKLILTVTDNGKGIPSNIKDKIFQPFFTTKPTGEGTGLGLSLSYDIVKAHGGEIRVQSKEGEGSVFTVQLPMQA